MKTIGLTGGIASGKTTVTAHLQELGAPVVDADVLAREVLAVGQPAYHEVVQGFGREVVTKDGQIDRSWLAERIFNDTPARELLNQITHPRIRRMIEERVEKLRSSGAKAVIISAPLLVESSMVSMMDEVWVVWVEREVQIERLMERDGCSVDEAEARLDAQLPLEEKLSYADAMINNNGSLQDTYIQAEQLWRRARTGGGEGETTY